MAKAFIFYNGLPIYFYIRRIKRMVADLMKRGLRKLHFLIQKLIYAALDLVKKPRGGYQLINENSTIN
jgi:hypothetical protein